MARVRGLSRYVRLLPRLLASLPNAARSPKLLGRCNICGHRTLFVAHSDNWRESLLCPWCGSYARKRHLAQVIMDTFPSPGLSRLQGFPSSERARGLSMYLAGSTGVLHQALKSLSGYACSDYMPGVEPGTLVDGVRCEDLQRLTFPDAQFDLAITEDVMEHVRHPDAAWTEIRRVLKPGGYHIFTTPVDPNLPSSVSRADTTGPQDVPILPPVYHGNPGFRGDARMLVYTDFGADLPGHLEALGMPTEVLFRRDIRMGIWGTGNGPSLVLRSRKLQ